MMTISVVVLMVLPSFREFLEVSAPPRHPRSALSTYQEGLASRKNYPIGGEWPSWGPRPCCPE